MSVEDEEHLKVCKHQCRWEEEEEEEEGEGHWKYREISY